MAIAAEPRRRWYSVASLLGHPPRPVLPPGALDLGGPAQPIQWIRLVGPVSPVAGLGVSRRADQALDVPARGQDEPAPAPHHLRRTIGQKPGHYVGFHAC